MRRFPCRRTATAAFLLAATACSEGGQSGVALPEVPTFEGTIELEIGDVDGDDPYLFSYIMDVVADELGRIIVADRNSAEIRVFGPEGDFAFHFGGPGEGPGEFGDLCCLGFAPGGELWVRQSARYSVFLLGSDGAEPQRVLRTPHPGQIGLMAPFTFDMGGNLVSVGPVSGNGGASLDARFRVLPDGAVDTAVMADAERQSVSQATVPFNRAGMSALVYLHQPFGPQWIHAHANGGTWADAVTSDYAINLHHPDGTVALIEGPALEGPPLSESDRDWAQTRMESELDRAGIGRHPFQIPDRKPPLADMFFDSGGRLWVVRTLAAGESVRSADVWDGTTLVAHYRWPSRIRNSPTPWATESALYGVTADTLGVQRTARVRFERR
ncbi:MAG: hypothetical protein J4G03_02815 [Gemmatimonadetes bacterium]|nr:hypothetical protein [Gemmatimonadota bacterium]